ncbi:MAG: dihydrolipoyl dehydrogenase [Planctomycetota bacterium]
MKTYDIIAIGTGSAMNLIEPVLESFQDIKIAVIDKDPPGGICLTKGCIPTKILVYPAEILRMLEGIRNLGLDISVNKINFQKIMKRMRSIVMPEIKNIRYALTHNEHIDYYPAAAEFVGPYQLRIKNEVITAKTIFLGLGSRPLIPAVKNLDAVRYYTSDSILGLKKLPKSIAIIGGGYIAAEYGHFFSAMGSKVSIIGRNSRFLPEEEMEISGLAKKEMSKYMKIRTNHIVTQVSATRAGQIQLVAVDKTTGKQKQFFTDEILLAAGRASNADILHPERSEIETDHNGWLKVNAYLETTKTGIWAFGDAIGRHPFKHVANYESKVVYHNALLGKKMKIDYRAVPHAVFSHPEVASVGLTEAQALEAFGAEQILIGFHRFQNTAKGEAMDLKNYFVKVVVEQATEKILGAHIIGPQASVLIQEIVTLMHSRDPSITPIIDGMHIHPSLSEVVERAFYFLRPIKDYHHLLNEGLL